MNKVYERQQKEGYSILEKPCLWESSIERNFTIGRLFRKRFRLAVHNRELEVRKLQTSRFFTVDLTKIKGKGDFSCPRCGTKISPDDRTEKTYKILEAHMRGDELDSIMLQCNKCESQIHVTGFHALSMIR